MPRLAARRPRAMLSLLAVGVLLLTGCAAEAGPDGADPDADVDVDSEPAAGADVGGAGATEVAAEPVVEGTAPAATSGDGDSSDAASESLWWTADTVDGDVLRAADLAGGNVVLWMWAPWCSVCNREAPEVAAALDALPDDVTVIGVAGRDDVAPMRAFVEEHGLQGITHVVDADGSLWASYGVSYQPAWVFIDAEGEASVVAGAIGYDGLLDGVRQVFGEA